jgi:hypothetical protein
VACTPVLKGSAEYLGLMQIWLDHLALALNELSKPNHSLE